MLAPGAPFHIHFSDIAFANRNETKHLRYGEGTLRADPLNDALEGFERTATVISESPDEASSQMIERRSPPDLRSGAGPLQRGAERDQDVHPEDQRPPGGDATMTPYKDRARDGGMHRFARRAR